MHSSIAFIFALALIFSIVTSPSSAQTSPCEKCIYDAVVQVQPACANIPYIGNMTSFDDSTWTSEQRACFCGLPACDSWYLHCAGPDKCDDFGFIFAYYAFFKIRRTPTCSSYNNATTTSTSYSYTSPTYTSPTYTSPTYTSPTYTSPTYTSSPTSTVTSAPAVAASIVARLRGMRP